MIFSDIFMDRSRSLIRETSTKPMLAASYASVS